MVKHIVIWKLKDSAEGKTKEENFKFIKQSLENLPVFIPEIKFIEVGRNFNADSNFDAVLYSEFDSPEDLEIYQNHPEHKKISAYVSKVRDERIVGDYIV